MAQLRRLRQQLFAAARHRQPNDCFEHRRGARAGQPRSQRHDVAAGNESFRVPDPGRVEFEPGQNPVDDGCVVDIEVRVVEPEGVERFDCGEQALRIRVEALRSDQFEAGRREFAHAALLRVLVAVRRSHIGQTQRQPSLAHARRD